MPSAWVPPAPRQGACTAEQIDDYYWHCFSSSADPQACDAFHRSPANDACASCIVTPDTAPLHGPLVSHDDGKTVEINVGGCVALARGGPGAACGASVQALVECTAAACSACSSDASGAPHCQCETAAQLGACRSYAEAAACITPYASAGNSDLAGCLGGTDFQTRYTPIVRYFCLAH
jgi:hypothetical protein